MCYIRSCSDVSSQRGERSDKLTCYMISLSTVELIYTRQRSLNLLMHQTTEPHYAHINCSIGHTVHMYMYRVCNIVYISVFIHVLIVTLYLEVDAVDEDRYC